MKILIKKNEYLYSEMGTHIIDSRGFAMIADEDTECEVAEQHVERVTAILEMGRAQEILHIPVTQEGDEKEIREEFEEPVEEPVEEP